MGPEFALPALWNAGQLMARIRSLKPELWMSSDFQALTILGRLAFIALISQADDEGRLKADAKHLANVFLDGARVSDVYRQLILMRDRGMVALYTQSGASYIALNNWNSHQKVEKKTDSRIPPPPVSPQPVGDHSPTPPRPVGEDPPVFLEDSPTAPPSRARGSIDRSKDLSIPPYPPTAQANGHATSDGGDEETTSSIWTADELQQRTLDVLAWWVKLSSQDLTTLTGQQARLTQDRALDVARKSYEVVDMCSAAEAWYLEQRNKPVHLYAPLLWPLFEQGGSAALKKRRPLGMEAVSSLAASALPARAQEKAPREADPDDGP